MPPFNRQSASDRAATPALGPTVCPAKGPAGTDGRFAAGRRARSDRSSSSRLAEDVGDLDVGDGCAAAEAGRSRERAKVDETNKRVARMAASSLQRAPAYSRSLGVGHIPQFLSPVARLAPWPAWPTLPAARSAPRGAHDGRNRWMKPNSSRAGPTLALSIARWRVRWRSSAHPRRGSPSARWVLSHAFVRGHLDARTPSAGRRLSAGPVRLSEAPRRLTPMEAGVGGRSGSLHPSHRAAHGGRRGRCRETRARRDVARSGAGPAAPAAPPPPAQGSAVAGDFAPKQCAGRAADDGPLRPVAALV